MNKSFVGSALLHLFLKAPCARGSISKSLGWGPHFRLNMLFAFLAGISLSYYRKTHKQIQKNISRARNQVNTDPVVKLLKITKYQET